MSFNINNINRKVVVFFSLFGFVLSLISGMFAKNSFLSLIMKSLLSGLIIGVIIILCNIVIMIFIPELLDKNEGSEEETEAGQDGQVNIVMPEEGYTVQKEDQFTGSEINTPDSYDSQDTDSDSGVKEEVSPGSEFKEVDMSNLKDLASIGVSDVQEDDMADSSGAMSSVSSDGDSIAGDHSVEEMAKAVKTVLKKD